ncbi:MAG TPA: excisionase family DNA-binding protein [Verrucomicrobiota bacterium]|nr:excisionase family DNA-binding protein [Verrucomicrobiota bacterium]
MASSGPAELRLLTRCEAADCLRVSERHIDRLIEMRALSPIYRLGRRAVRIPARALESYLASRAV